MLKIPAGPELNVLVAKVVMEYVLDYEFADSLGAPAVPALRDNYDEWGILPDFSHDWNCIKPIAEKLRAENFVLRTNMSMDGYGATFHRGWETGAISGLTETSYASDLAHAVCLAALQAKGYRP
jgi:hypothetical protein